MVTERTEFKGHKLINLKVDDQDDYGFQFGLKKAKLIIDNFEDIKVFVQEQETKQEGE